MRVLVVGAGGHGAVVADILLACARRGGLLELLGFLDDDASLQGQKILGLPVLGMVEALGRISHDGIVVAIGQNRVRHALLERLGSAGECILSAVHPAAVVAPSVMLGAGTVVCAGAVVNPCAQVGAGVILNTTCSVDHHCVLDDCVHVAPGAHTGGNVHLGEGVLLGLGAGVLPGCSVGAWSVVGGGALVADNVPAGRTVVGVPARILDKKV
ncbi:MAG: NeuD/PglB/VioB family sugar acetyltransferase [Anaerolineae bacterium]